MLSTVFALLILLSLLRRGTAGRSPAAGMNRIEHINQGVESASTFPKDMREVVGEVEVDDDENYQDGRVREGAMEEEGGFQLVGEQKWKRKNII